MHQLCQHLVSYSLILLLTAASVLGLAACGRDDVRKSMNSILPMNAVKSLDVILGDEDFLMTTDDVVNKRNLGAYNIESWRCIGHCFYLVKDGFTERQLNELCMCVNRLTWVYEFTLTDGDVCYGGVSRDCVSQKKNGRIYAGSQLEYDFIDESFLIQYSTLDEYYDAVVKEMLAFAEFENDLGFEETSTGRTDVVVETEKTQETYQAFADPEAVTTDDPVIQQLYARGVAELIVYMAMDRDIYEYLPMETELEAAYLLYDPFTGKPESVDILIKATYILYDGTVQKERHVLTRFTTDGTVLANGAMLGEDFIPKYNSWKDMTYHDSGEYDSKEACEEFLIDPLLEDGTACVIK